MRFGLTFGIAVALGLCGCEESVEESMTGNGGDGCEDAVVKSEVSADPAMPFPTLVVDGKRVAVSAQKYIAHHVQTATGKYLLLPVPDG